MNKRRAFPGALENGFTIFELLVVLGLMSVLLLVAVSNLKELNRPLLNGTAHLSSFIKEVRAKALTTTSAYEIYWSSSTDIRSRYASTCADDEFTDDPLLALEMPDGATVVETEWSICFSSRGIASDNLTLTVQDTDYQQREIEVLLGGSVRVM